MKTFTSSFHFSPLCVSVDESNKTFDMEDLSKSLDVSVNTPSEGNQTFDMEDLTKTLESAKTATSEAKKIVDKAAHSEAKPQSQTNKSDQNRMVKILTTDKSGKVTGTKLVTKAEADEYVRRQRERGAVVKNGAPSQQTSASQGSASASQGSSSAMSQGSSKVNVQEVQNQLAKDRAQKSQLERALAQNRVRGCYCLLTQIINN